MSLRETLRKARLFRALHWLVAGLLPFQMAFGLISERVSNRPLSHSLLGAHFQLGVILLVLMVIRIGAWARAESLRLRRPAGGTWWRRPDRIVHITIYLLLIALPVTGYVIWIWMGADRAVLGIVELPALFVPPTDAKTGRAIAWYVHVYGAWLLIGLVAVHVAGAVRGKRS